ncbi:MAG: Rne/Rng family ribonuclease [Deltaproteobacteria bacterium]|nr:Rne/Rng family ribonuclease [Deltaproteobacteria bacterium]
MPKKILVNASYPEEVRVAVVEEGVLTDFSIETSTKENIKGNIYKGTITKIEPSFQAAFVNYGGVKNGFLPCDEIHPDFWIRKDFPPDKRPKIQDILRRKQEVLVQVTREGMGNKGAALTTYLSLPGRYLVLMPGSNSSGVSRKIEDEAQRKRLKEIVRQFDLPEGMGFIVRTAGMNRSKKELLTDFGYFMRLWENIKTRNKELPTPSLIYHESDVVVKSIREYFSPEVKEVIIDEEEAYKRAKEFFKEIMPKYRRRVKLYQDEQPLFSRFQVEQQIEHIYSRVVPLKSGGRICIDIAEALVAIDVNSGRVPQAKDIEEAALITNLEAAEEIARQMRLRDIGGLIVIDFIDMRSSQHNREVERRLRNTFKKDRAKVDLSRISKFGILELSRQRLKPSLSEGVYLTCQYCQGRGRVRSPYSMALTVLRKIQERVIQDDLQMIRGTLHKTVAEYLLNYKRDDLNAIERKYGLQIVIIGQEDMSAEEFQLDFIKAEKSPVALMEKEDESEKEEKERPWYKKLLPI